MYRIIEVAELLGVSKVTIYKKIEQLKPEILPHMKAEEGISYVDDFGVNLIKDSIKRRKTRKPRDKALLKVVDLNCELNDSFNRQKELEEKLIQIEEKYKEEIIINNRHLDDVLSNKKVELKRLIASNEDLRKLLERANGLLNQLERAK